MFKGENFIDISKLFFKDKKKVSQNNLHDTIGI